MKVKNLIIISILVVAYTFNSNLLEWVYPNAKNDYYEFLKYYDLRKPNILCNVFFFSF